MDLASHEVALTALLRAACHLEPAVTDALMTNRG
jgi:hypothetical protein